MRDPKELLESMTEKQTVNGQAIQKLQKEMQERSDLQMRISGAIEVLNLLLAEEPSEEA